MVDDSNSVPSIQESKIILSGKRHDQINIEMIAFPDHDSCQSLLPSVRIARSLNLKTFVDASNELGQWLIHFPHC